MNNLTFFLNRVKPYNPAGRVQTEAKAKDIDFEMRNLLMKHNIDYENVDADKNAPIYIASQVMKCL